MIERRRLFLRSDFLRDMTQPARSVKYCAVWVRISKKQWNHVAKATPQPNGRYESE